MGDTAVQRIRSIVSWASRITAVVFSPWFMVNVAYLFARRSAPHRPGAGPKGMWRGLAGAPVQLLVPNGGAIIHLSDPHVPQSLPYDGVKSTPMERFASRIWGLFARRWTDRHQRIMARLSARLATLKPTAIIITGDLVDESPHESQLLAAARFLARLSKFLPDGQQPRLLFVLGNHDTKLCGNNWFLPRAIAMLLSWVCALGLTSAPSAWAIRAVAIFLTIGWILEVALWTWERRSTGPIRKTCHFIEERAKAYGLEEQHSEAESDVSDVLAIRVFGFDSSSRSSLFGFATGRIARDTYSCGELVGGAEGGLGIGVLHHHPLPMLRDGADEPDSLMMCEDAGGFLASCIDHRLEVILHGHKHLPDKKELLRDGRTLLVAGAGTVFADEPPERVGFGVLRVQRQGDRVGWSYEFEPLAESGLPLPWKLTSTGPG